MKFIVENSAEIKDIIEYHNDIEIPDYSKILKK